MVTGETLLTLGRNETDSYEICLGAVLTIVSGGRNVVKQKMRKLN